MKAHALLAAIFIFAAPACSSYAQTPPVEDGAQVQKAALDWLALIENKEYGRSWEASSEFFKKQTKRQDWIIGLQLFRRGLGALKSRSVAVTDHTGSRPARQVCTVTFFTQYEHRTFQRESLLLVFENGDWRVAGYYVK